MISFVSFHFMLSYEASFLLCKTALLWLFLWGWGGGVYESFYVQVLHSVLEKSWIIMIFQWFFIYDSTVQLEKGSSTFLTLRCTVIPPINGHPQNQKKWPLKRGVGLWDVKNGRPQDQKKWPLKRGVCLWDVKNGQQQDQKKWPLKRGVCL